MVIFLIYFAGKLLFLSILKIFSYKYSLINIFRYIGWHSGYVIDCHSIGVSSITPGDIFLAFSVWLKRDSTDPKPDQNCASYSTGPNVCHPCCQHSFSTPVVKGPRKFFCFSYFGTFRNRSGRKKPKPDFSDLDRYTRKTGN